MSEQTKVTGIILSVYPVGENDRRLTILTKERGKLQVFARGSRRPKHPLFGVTQPLIYCEFMVTDTRNYTYLNSAECKDYFHFLKDNLEILQFAGFGLQCFQCVHCGNDENLIRISFEDGGMLCSTCAAKGQGREVSSSVLYVLQYVSSVPLNQLYSFGLKETIEKEFEWVVNRYFTVHVEHKFKAAEMLAIV